MVRYLVTSLVEHPEGVRIEKRDGAEATAYEVTVHPDDTGKVIGRQGRVIKAIRVLVRAAASANETDATVEIVG
ncbi:MAG: KH domain-containing protein [Actinobacteria bacterium]|nr:KH domain-containing protein [Actinomycetota bacterium]